MSGAGPPGSSPTTISSDTSLGSVEKLGRRRAGAALLMMLGLPGSAFIYQGEELGLEQVDIPDHLKQDPIFFRTEGSKPGRDGCRVPIPWVQAPPGFGFTAEEPWLPMPEDWGRLSVAAQKDDPASMLSLYRKALRAREKSAVLAEGDFAWVEGAEGILAYERIGEQTLVCVCNFSSEEAAVDLKGDLILASDDDVSVRNRKLALPGDSAAWIST